MCVYEMSIQRFNCSCCLMAKWPLKGLSFPRNSTRCTDAVNVVLLTEHIFKLIWFPGVLSCCLAT